MHTIDTKKLQAWVTNSPSESVMLAKKKLVENVTYVSRDDFLNSIKKVVTRLNFTLVEPYAVLWDYKPHSSKRWVYHKAKKFLGLKPSLETYFAPATEKALKILPSIIDKQMKQIVIFDDACYSGEQLINKTLIPLIEFYSAKQHSISIIIVIPYITTTAYVRLRKIADQREKFVKTTLICDVVMPTVAQLLTPVELKSFKIDTSREMIPEFAYAGVTLTYFDHRVADGYSFADEFREFIDVGFKPYSLDVESKYVRDEIKEWDKFWQKWLDFRKNRD